ncbi:MAG TPA: hypothetical protein VKB51_15885 [bacterium]|nr:hypothetical protein [bacterium]
MSLTVSSWFLAQSLARRAAPLRRFTLGGSDYSDAVLRWPTLRFRADTIDLGTTTLQLTNIGRAFQAVVDCPALLTTSVELALGYAHPDSGPEYLSLFLGVPSHAAFERGGTELRLQLQGRTRRLSDVSLGTATQSAGLDFTGSASHPADLAWTLITCHGGFSTLTSESNPDIDYAGWRAWQDADAVRDVRVQAYLTGERIYQVLDTLALMDSRVISFENGRLRFRDAVQPFGAAPPAFPPETVLEASLALDPARLVTRFFVEAAYDPTKGAFTAQYSKVHSAAEATFGEHSARFSSRGVWFAGGADARYLAEDRVRFGHALLPLLQVRTPLAGGLQQGVGEVVAWSDSYFGIAAQPFRVLEQAVDLQTGEVHLTLEAAHHRPWQFQATVDSTENLHVRTLAAIGSGSLLALADASGGDRLMRLDGSSGTAVALDARGTALAVLADGALLLGGPPSSGSAQAVLQRSADAGSSTAVVSSLAPNVPVVYDLFEVRSGTCLAATHSGGIWRSTDAGSSWALTQTISGAWHVQRFFQPCSGTLWGGTGASDPVLGTGLHVWVSTDDGVNWSPHLTVYSADAYRAGGWYHLSDSAWLLAHTGAGAGQRGVLRGTGSASGSVTWTRVLSGESFAHVLPTDSGHLLFGFDEPGTVDGGAIYRSLDLGASWLEDARLAKRGNIALLPNADGTVEAFVARMSVGPRTDCYRNYAPDELT